MAYSKKTDYFELWRLDRQDMMCTMVRNMTADLQAGYSPLGSTVSKQMDRINEFRKEYDGSMRALRGMTEEQANRWCYVELVRLGSIE